MHPDAVHTTQNSAPGRASAADAFSGNPAHAALASFAAGGVQASLLLPLNTLQTHMQHHGRPYAVTMRTIFAKGGLSGVRLLYRAWIPTIGMLGARQALKFGAGAAIKSGTPIWWPELARDAVSGGLSAAFSTTLLFPLDTLKTRMQLGQQMPPLRQIYNGYTPAVVYSAFGMSLWVCSRNALERSIPDQPPGTAAQHWKHFLCGAVAGVCVQVPTYPLDTLKKRMQASNGPARAVLDEAGVLLRSGGLLRMYNGFGVKVAFVALNSAIFNSVYVQCRRLLHMHQ